MSEQQTQADPIAQLDGLVAASDAVCRGIADRSPEHLDGSNMRRLMMARRSLADEAVFYAALAAKFREQAALIDQLKSDLAALRAATQPKETK